MDRTLKGDKRLVWSCVSFKFLFLLKVKPFQPLLLNDPHNKMLLIDSYPTWRAANGLSLPVCPVYLHPINMSVSTWQIIHCVCEWMRHIQAQRCQCLLMRNRVLASLSHPYSWICPSLFDISDASVIDHKLSFHTHEWLMNCGYPPSTPPPPSSQAAALSENQ